MSMLQTVVMPGELRIGALLLGLAIAIILHEVAHGLAALKLGDPTAQLAGRLTLNPIKHVDMWGTIIVPLFLLILNSVSGGGFLFGWAKPVPVNYYNLRKGKYGPAIVAMAGPATNLLLLMFFGLLARWSPMDTMLPVLFGIIALVNGWLMLFNLIPIPPLDGSKILYIFLQNRPDIIQFLERNGFMILLLFIFFGGALLSLLTVPLLVLMSYFTGEEVLRMVLVNMS